MAEQRDKKKSRFLARWFLLIPAVVIVITVIVLAWYYEPAQIWYRETRQERVLRETLAGIQEYNVQLQEELRSLETTQGIEDFARNELNLVEEGDRSIIVTRDGEPITEPRSNREATIAAIPENSRPFGAWTDFLDTLFGIE
ncbi:MAG: septum formation initiator family protein [Coriobacteriia bacterium]|nr:septum formation initiator family protein [Coriobacteriia bacterium]